MSEREHLSISLSVHLVTGAWVTCHRYDASPPILAISDAGTHLSITSPRRQETTPDDVKAARALLTEVQTYVAECERLCPNKPLIEQSAA